jgi:hypothetical protein
LSRKRFAQFLGKRQLFPEKGKLPGQNFKPDKLLILVCQAAKRCFFKYLFNSGGNFTEYLFIFTAAGSVVFVKAAAEHIFPRNNFHNVV